MQEAEWPKRYYWLPAVRRNLSLFLLIPTAFVLLAAILRSSVVELALFGMMAALALLNELKARRPAAEAWPDHVKIQSSGTWRLIPIQYAQIRRLEGIPHIRFTVFYESSGTQRKVYIPGAYLPGLDSLKEFLQVKSGVEISSHNPWWARLLTRNGPLIAWDEPGAWMKALLLSFLPLIVYAHAAVGLPLAWRWLSDINVAGRSLPFGVGMAVGLLAFAGSFLLLRRGHYILVAAGAVLLTLFPLVVLWQRFGLRPPTWMWFIPITAIGLLVAAIAIRRDQRR